MHSRRASRIRHARLRTIEGEQRNERNRSHSKQARGAKVPRRPDTGRHRARHPARGPARPVRKERPTLEFPRDPGARHTCGAGGDQPEPCVHRGARRSAWRSSRRRLRRSRRSSSTRDRPPPACSSRRGSSASYPASAPSTSWRRPAPCSASLPTGTCISWSRSAFRCPKTRGPAQAERGAGSAWMTSCAGSDGEQVRPPAPRRRGSALPVSPRRCSSFPALRNPSPHGKVLPCTGRCREGHSRPAFSGTGAAGMATFPVELRPSMPHPYHRDRHSRGSGNPSVGSKRTQA